VVVETDPDRARTIVRENIAPYFDLASYVNNWRRHGFTDQDVRAPGGDRLIGALIAWGDEQAVAVRVSEHRDAGADHVCVQIMIGCRDAIVFPREHWQRLAPALVEGL
jgi:probable F420-dependent oxidoreductase